MRDVLRIGSRESVLAVRQAEIVRDGIQRKHPNMKIEIVTMKTTGDKILNRSLAEIGGKGLFVKELDLALLNGEIDLSVHSLKDMPMETARELPIVAYTKREDPRDVLILAPGMQELPKDPIIGSSSKRRMIQMERLYPDAVFRGIRGNVQTRLRKLEEEDYDGTILAAAGLRRLGMLGCAGRIFTPDEMIPAAGQGVLAVQGRKGEDISYLEEVLCEESRIVSMAERRFVQVLNGGCTSPVAAYAQKKNNEILIQGLYYCEETGNWTTGKIAGAAERGEQLAETLALQLKARYQ